MNTWGECSDLLRLPFLLVPPSSYLVWKGYSPGLTQETSRRPSVPWNFSLPPTKEVLHFPLLPASLLAHCPILVDRELPPGAAQERVPGRPTFETLCVCGKKASFHSWLWLTIWPGPGFQTGGYFPSDLEGKTLFQVPLLQLKMIPAYFLSLCMWPTFSLLKLLGKISFMICFGIGPFLKNSLC